MSVDAASTETRAVIEFDRVCFGYHECEVLHNVNISIPDRAMVALVGPNGGGKTTLLKLILGQVTPRRGHIQVLGQAPRSACRQIGYVPQHLLYDPHFPVLVEDVVLMGRIDRHWAGPWRRSDRSAAHEALEQVGLPHLGRRPFDQLSGGERQRTLIAQALVSQPKILLMDEPTANIDAAAEHRFYELLGTLKPRHTILLVSHNVNVVTGHASHVICVNHTADIHAVGEVTSSVFEETYGGRMTVIKHDEHCSIFDSSVVMSTPHQADRGEGS
jgi:zinc transport system ATP-binding protein